MARCLNILVVDDDRDNADSLAEIFKLEGHAVEVAYSGVEAIEAYQRIGFDIAFMDVMMPGKNGLESFLEIKRLKPGAKVYMMTGYSVEQVLRQAIDNGALGVFSKPFVVDEVLAAIDAAGPNGLLVVPSEKPGFGPKLQRSIEARGKTCGLVTAQSAPCPADGASGMDGKDTIVMDLASPLIDGIELYAALRSRCEMSPPVVIAADSGEHDDVFAALGDVELTGILNKPFDPVMLLAKLDRLAPSA